MKAERQAPAGRSSDRRRVQSGDGRTAVRRPNDRAPSRRTRPRAGKTSAPGRDSGVPQSGPQTASKARPDVRSAQPKNASQAKARAKARKAKAPKVIRPPLRDRLIARLAGIDLRPRALAVKVPFVVLVIGSLGAGLALTLWLSTDSAERSYQLGNARQQNQLLQQQKEALERDVLEAQAAPALAEAARNLGMIPSKDTAHLVQDLSGNWVVVGTPKPAEGVPPPPLNTKLPDEKPAPPAPPVDSVEVPVRVPSNGGQPIAPRASGPEVLIRTPDGSTTLGTQHLPTGGPSLPGPVAAPPAGEPMPAAPGPVAPPPPEAPGPVAPPPPEAPGPVAPPPPEAPAPVAPPAGEPMAAAPVPGAPSPAGTTDVEQFGPVTATTPGAAR